MHELGVTQARQGKDINDIASANIDTLLQKTRLGFITTLQQQIFDFFIMMLSLAFEELISLLSKFLKEKTHPMMKAGAKSMPRTTGLGTRRRKIWANLD